MAIDIDAIIEEGNATINVIAEIVALAQSTQGKVGGVSDLTSTQIQEIKEAAVVAKGKYETSRDLFEAAF